MPRPGPRPYECVRRAWHSERHQPMRGLVIQQVFRLVHDNHSAATKKNKEWQEKLPVVVFKAEEIMYSKANSEAEYSNIETLWDRANDAVDTIIRKDESVETGELLPPCVEAALNLGCVPVRASRSQRHNNPRTYLRPQRESNTMSLKDNVKIPQNVDSSRLVWECNKRNADQHIASSFEKLHSAANKHGVEMDRRGSVYPLYYGASFKPDVHLQEAQNLDSVIIGVPVFSSAAEPAALHNLFPYREDKYVGKRACEVAPRDNKGKGPQVGFDLSLRLGMFPDSNSGREKGSSYLTESIGHKISTHDVLPVEKEFSFFPMESAHNKLSWLHTSKEYEESESQNEELVSRKRKLPFSGDIGNDQFFWSQDSTSHFVGQMRRPVSEAVPENYIGGPTLMIFYMIQENGCWSEGNEVCS